MAWVGGPIAAWLLWEGPQEQQSYHDTKGGDKQGWVPEVGEFPSQRISCLFRSPPTFFDGKTGRNLFKLQQSSLANRHPVMGISFGKVQFGPRCLLVFTIYREQSLRNWAKFTAVINSIQRSWIQSSSASGPLIPIWSWSLLAQCKEPMVHYCSLLGHAVACTVKTPWICIPHLQLKRSPAIC